MIRLRFSTDRHSIVSWLIRVRTDWNHSHVELEREDGWTLGSRFSLWGKVCRLLAKVVCGLQGKGKRTDLIGSLLLIKCWRWLDRGMQQDGVQLRPPSANANQTDVAHRTFDGIDLVWQELMTMLGTPYDIRGIFGIATAKDWHEKGSAFCSEAISAASQAHGIYFQNRLRSASWWETPADIEKSLIVRDAETSVHV